jgi:LPS export ABC transporter protein LptC
MKNFLKRQWPLIGLGLVVTSVAFYIIRYGGEYAQRSFLWEAISGDGAKLKEIHYTQDDPDKGLKWVLDASEVKFSEDNRSILFHDFHLKVEPEKRPYFELKGNKGDYSRDSGEINLWGDLEGFSGDGYRIVSEHLLINEKRGHVSTEKSVKIFGPFFSVAGQGLFFDLEKERLRILSDVTTILKRESLI